jgi:hypothetical protein
VKLRKILSLAFALLATLSAYAGQVVGVLATPTGGPIRKATLTFVLKRAEHPGWVVRCLDFTRNMFH